MSLFQFLSHLRKKIMQGLVYIIQLLVQRLLEHKGHMYLYATVPEAPKLERQVCHNTESTSHRAAESKSALSYCLGEGLSFQWKQQQYGKNLPYLTSWRHSYENLSGIKAEFKKTLTSRLPFLTHTYNHLEQQVCLTQLLKFTGEKKVLKFPRFILVRCITPGSWLGFYQSRRTRKATRQVNRPKTSTMELP